MTTIEEFRKRYIYDQNKDYLGDGAFGNVFRAYDTETETYVAIKIVNRTNSENAKYNLAKEAEIAQNIRDKKNIAIYTICYKVATPTGYADIAVMHLYEAGNLEDFLAGYILPAKERMQLISGILNGLKAIHGNKVIHRDLKPQNILINIEDGSIVPKISDFGISKKSDNLENSAFSNSLVGGTIAYSSPEQLKAETQSLKANTDIWSLGVILYQIFIGTNPFSQGLYDVENKDEKRREILKRIRVAELPKELSSIPEPYQKIIRRCIVVNPGRRIGSVAEIDNILEQFRQETEGTHIAPPPGPSARRRSILYLIVSFAAWIALFIGVISIILFAVRRYWPSAEAGQEMEADSVAQVVDPTTPFDSLPGPVVNNDSIKSSMPVPHPDQLRDEKRYAMLVSAILDKERKKDWEGASKLVTNALGILPGSEKSRIAFLKGKASFYSARLHEDTDARETAGKLAAYDTSALDFKFGKLRVTRQKSSGKYGAIDAKGNKVIDFAYETYNPLATGEVIFYDNNGKSISSKTLLKGNNQ